MSSHHFVKEGQEPAVLFLEPEPITDQTLDLLEWSPFVVAETNCCEKLQRWAVKIDLEIAFRYEPAHNTILNHTDYVDLIHSIVSEKKEIRAIHVIASSETIAQFASQLIKSDLSTTIDFFDGSHRYLLNTKGGFNKWLPFGDIISVYPLAETKPDLSLQGLSEINHETSQPYIDLKVVVEGIVEVKWNDNTPVLIKESYTN